ncbi:MAG: LPS export ABC transporter periplasmic protein LptC [bacterium]
MDKLKNLTPALIALIMLGFFIWALMPKDDFSDKISEKLNNEKQKADVVFKAATLAEVSDGIKYWELVAKTAVINKSLGVANLSVVDGLFFDKGHPTIKFLAPSAVWRINKNEIVLADPIGYDIKYEKTIKDELAKIKDPARLSSFFHLPEKIGKKYEGYWFSAKNLDWKLSTKKLLCSGAITLTKGDIMINAEELEADVGLEKVSLTGNPSGEIFTDSKKINITADKFLVDSYQDIVTADKNVIVTRNGSKLNADKAVYDQKKGAIELSGGVSLTRDNNKVYGEKMLLLLSGNKIIIQGRTKAQITGAEIR